MKAGALQVETVAILCPYCLEHEHEVEYETPSGYGYLYMEDMAEMPSTVKCRECGKTYSKPKPPKSWGGTEN
jgi:hypothetical protein